MLRFPPVAWHSVHIQMGSLAVAFRKDQAGVVRPGSRELSSWRRRYPFRFNFSGYTGDYTGTAVAGLVPMTAARKVVGNFSAAGQPSLFASAGARADGSQPASERYPLRCVPQAAIRR